MIQKIQSKLLPFFLLESWRHNLLSSKYFFSIVAKNATQVSLLRILNLFYHVWENPGQNVEE